MLEERLKTLEAEIKRLNENFEKLGFAEKIVRKDQEDFDNLLQNADMVDEKLKDKIEKVDDDALTAEVLQKKCLKLVRKKPNDKVKIFTLLKEYDVKSVREMSEEQRVSFHDKLEELE